MLEGMVLVECFAHSRIKNYLATVTITILSYQKL